MQNAAEGVLIATSILVLIVGALYIAIGSLCLAAGPLNDVRRLIRTLKSPMSDGCLRSRVKHRS